MLENSTTSASGDLRHAGSLSSASRLRERSSTASGKLERGKQVIQIQELAFKKGLLGSSESFHRAERPIASDASDAYRKETTISSRNT